MANANEAIISANLYIRPWNRGGNGFLWTLRIYSQSVFRFVCLFLNFPWHQRTTGEFFERCQLFNPFALANLQYQLSEKKYKIFYNELHQAKWLLKSTFFQKLFVYFAAGSKRLFLSRFHTKFAHCPRKGKQEYVNWTCHEWVRYLIPLGIFQVLKWPTALWWRRREE